MVFEDGEDWTQEFLKAHANGDIVVVINFEAMTDELLERICAFQERREFVKKSVGQLAGPLSLRLAREALTRFNQERAERMQK
jgi:hypothetical protein